MGDIPTSDGASFWHLDVDNLIIQEEIGSGSFGKIHKADYLGTTVAVKKLSKDPSQDAVLLRFVEREVEILKYNHPNMVSLIGIVEHGNDILLVTEYVPGGDLSKYLRTPAIPLPWLTRVRIATDVAAAMAYLHSKNIMHRDLKSKNCLVSDNWKIKLCDFGFARKTDKKSRFMTICGTDEWMAPEVITGTEYDFSADVFSFGILLSEIITRKRILHIAPRMPATFYAFDDASFAKHVPPDCPPQLRALAMQCCTYFPGGRPAFRDIVSKLREIEPTLGGGSLTLSLSASSLLPPSLLPPQQQPQPAQAAAQNTNNNAPANTKQHTEDDKSQMGSAHSPVLVRKGKEHTRVGIFKQLVDDFLKAPMKTRKKEGEERDDKPVRRKSMPEDIEKVKHSGDDDRRKSSKSPRHHADKATDKEKEKEREKEKEKKHSPERERRHKRYSFEFKQHSPERAQHSPRSPRKDRERDREDKTREKKTREKEERAREREEKRDEKTREKERERDKERRERKRSTSVKKERKAEEREREKEKEREKATRRRSMSLADPNNKDRERELREKIASYVGDADVDVDTSIRKLRSVTFSN